MLTAGSTAGVVSLVSFTAGGLAIAAWSDNRRRSRGHVAVIADTGQRATQPRGPRRRPQRRRNPSHGSGIDCQAGSPTTGSADLRMAAGDTGSGKQQWVFRNIAGGRRHESPSSSKPADKTAEPYILSSGSVSPARRSGRSDSVTWNTDSVPSNHRATAQPRCVTAAGLG